MPRGRLAVILLAFWLLSGSLSVADEPKLTAVEREVVDAWRARTEASNRRDQAAWSRYVAEDCIFSGDNGERLAKPEVARVIEKFPADYDHSENAHDFLVHVYGNVAVLNVQFTTHERFTDADIVSEMRATETFIKREGSWLLVARQWEKIPVNFRKAAPIDTNAYKDYIGEYEWRPLDDLETLWVKDGKLWTRSGKDVDEYLPLGKDIFFLKTDLGTSKFVRDANGRVTGYTYQSPDGQEIHVKKIK
jgi:ketosteroid isomerase-like protein